MAYPRPATKESHPDLDVSGDSVTSFANALAGQLAHAYGRAEKICDSLEPAKWGQVATVAQEGLIGTMRSNVELCGQLVKMLDHLASKIGG